MEFGRQIAVGRLAISNFPALQFVTLFASHGENASRIILAIVLCMNEVHEAIAVLQAPNNAVRRIWILVFSTAIPVSFLVADASLETDVFYISIVAFEI